MKTDNDEEFLESFKELDSMKKEELKEIREQLVLLSLALSAEINRYTEKNMRINALIRKSEMLLYEKRGEKIK